MEVIIIKGNFHQIMFFRDGDMVESLARASLFVLILQILRRSYNLEFPL